MADKVATNTFEGGMNLDLDPLVAPKNVMSGCLNGTLTTFNGLDGTLQNDMGNANVKYTDEEGNTNDVQLSEGFIPVGSCSFGGVVYIASYNPISKEGEIGSYPSTKRTINEFEKNKKSSLDLETLFSDGELTIPLYDESGNEQLIAAPYDYIQLDFSGDEYLKELIDSEIIIPKVIYGSTEADLEDDKYINKTDAYNNIYVYFKWNDDYKPDLYYDYAKGNLYVTVRTSKETDKLKYTYSSIIYGGKSTNSEITIDGYTYCVFAAISTKVTTLQVDCDIQLNDSTTIATWNITKDLLDKYEIEITKDNTYITTNFQYYCSNNIEEKDNHPLIWSIAPITGGSSISNFDKSRLSIDKEIIKVPFGVNTFVRPYLNTGLYNDYYDKESIKDFANIKVSPEYVTNSTLINSEEYFNALEIAQNPTNGLIKSDYTFNINTSSSITQDYLPYTLDNLLDEEYNEIDISATVSTTDKVGDIYVLGDYDYDSLINKEHTLALGVCFIDLDKGNDNVHDYAMMALPLRSDDKGKTYYNRPIIPTSLPKNGSDPDEVDNDQVMYVGRGTDVHQLDESANDMIAPLYKGKSEISGYDSAIQIIKHKRTDSSTEIQLKDYQTSFNQFVLDYMGDSQFGWLGGQFLEDWSAYIGSISLKGDNRRFLKGTDFVGMYTSGLTSLDNESTNDESVHFTYCGHWLPSGNSEEMTDKTEIFKRINSLFSDWCYGKKGINDTSDIYNRNKSYGYMIYYTCISKTGDTADLIWYHTKNGSMSIPDNDRYSNNSGYIIWKISDEEFILVGSENGLPIVSSKYFLFPYYVNNSSTEIKYVPIKVTSDKYGGLEGTYDFDLDEYKINPDYDPDGESNDYQSVREMLKAQLGNEASEETDNGKENNNFYIKTNSDNYITHIWIKLNRNYNVGYQGLGKTKIIDYNSFMKEKIKSLFGNCSLPNIVENQSYKEYSLLTLSYTNDPFDKSTSKELPNAVAYYNEINELTDNKNDSDSRIFKNLLIPTNRSYTITISNKGEEYYKNKINSKLSEIFEEVENQIQAVRFTTDGKIYATLSTNSESPFIEIDSIYRMDENGNCVEVNYPFSVGLVNDLNVIIPSFTDFEKNTESYIYSYADCSAKIYINELDSYSLSDSTSDLEDVVFDLFGYSVSGNKEEYEITFTNIDFLEENTSADSISKLTASYVEDKKTKSIEYSYTISGNKIILKPNVDVKNLELTFDNNTITIPIGRLKSGSDYNKNELTITLFQS